MSDEAIEKLAKIGVHIERTFGTPRDIEWAISSDGLNGYKVYILQARPITTMDQEEQWELEREFDTPMASEEEWITSANIREMIPGAMTPLSAEMWLQSLCYSSDRDQQMFLMKPWRRIPVYRAFAMYQQHPFLNYTAICGATTTKKDTKLNIEMAIFGQFRPELQESIDAKEYMRYHQSPLLFFQRIHHFYRIFFPERQPRKFEKKLEQAYPLNANEPELLYQQIKDIGLEQMKTGWLQLNRMCSRPIAMQIFILKLLNRNTEQWGPRETNDLAILLQSCPDVYTVDVPKQIKAIADAIYNAGCQDQFIAMTDSEAAEWLISSELGMYHVIFDHQG